MARQPRFPPQVDEFLRIIRQKYKPCQVILFGSQARGDTHEWSDYDFLIISPAFHGKDWFDRGVEVRMLYRAPFPLDVICLTPEELEERRNGYGIVAVAVKEGIALTA